MCECVLYAGYMEGYMYSCWHMIHHSWERGPNMDEAGEEESAHTHTNVLKIHKSIYINEYLYLYVFT